MHVLGCAQAVVADAKEIVWKHVEEESAYKFDRIKGKNFPLGTVCVILDLEGHPAVLQREEPVVGDRDSVRIAAEVTKDLLGSAKRRLGIHHPIFAVKSSKKTSPRGLICKGGTRSVHIEFPCKVCFVESMEKLSTEKPPKHFNG